MKRRIMSGALMSLDDLSRDLFVMCNNAMVFNGKGDPYFDYSKVIKVPWEKTTLVSIVSVSPTSEIFEGPCILPSSRGTSIRLWARRGGDGET